MFSVDQAIDILFPTPKLLQVLNSLDYRETKPKLLGRNADQPGTGLSSFLSAVPPLAEASVPITA